MNININGVSMMEYKKRFIFLFILIILILGFVLYRGFALSRNKISEEQAKELMSKSQSLYLSLVNAQSSFNSKSPELKVEGDSYWLYVRDERINSKEKIMNLLNEVYTSKLSEKIYKDLNFEEIDGRIRRPVSDVGTLADYVNAKINHITAFRNRCKVEATVPHSMDDDDILSYSEETMEFVYEKGTGWRLNTLVF